MEINKNKIKDIKSFCKKYFKGFASVIFKYETSKLDIDLLSLENIFIQSIDSIGRILSSSFFIKNEIHLNGSKQFGLKHFTCVQYISSILINIIDLPILFPKTARLAAIRQIGKIVSRVGWLKDPKYQRVVYSTAKNFQSRVQVSVNFSSDFDCAYLFALSHMAIDPQLQDILLKVIEFYIPILTSSTTSTTNDLNRNLNDIKISVCKAVQKLDQSSERLYKIMKSLAEDKTALPEVSSEASLAFLCMSIKSNKRDTVKRITKGLNELILNSEHPSDIKSAIKMLYNICSSYPSQKNELLPILIEFIKGDYTVHRDYALYILTKLEIELNHKEYIQEIFQMVKDHFSKRMNPDSNYPILKYIMKTASLICSNYVEYAAELNESIISLLNSFPFKSESTSTLFDVKIAFTDKEIEKASAKSKTKKDKHNKRKQDAESKSENDKEADSVDTLSNDNDEDTDKNDNENEKEVENSTSVDVLANESVEDPEQDDDQISDIEDPFDGYEPPIRKISPNTIAVLSWRRELANSQQLVAFDVKVPEIGYAEKTEWLSPPKGFQIYEDVVAHFVICCAYPEKSNLALQPFFQHLSDTQRQMGRNPASWEQISVILGQFSVLNYVQLFFSLCFMQQQKQDGEMSDYDSVEFEAVKDLMYEMHTIMELINKQKKEKAAKRVPSATTEPPPKSRATRF